jgi:cell wall-associated NlpC family hydrolase
MRPIQATTRRSAYRRIAAATAVAVAIGLGAVAVPAQANPAGPHDPIGAVASVKSVTGGLRFTGWAADPDALTSNASVAVIVDGRTTVASARTSVANPTVTAKYRTGPTPGFAIISPIATGTHTVCLVVHTIGRGMDTVLKCVIAPLGTRLSAAQVATHNPLGAIAKASATSTSVRFAGWSSDPDYVARRLVVVLYVDGAPAATVSTTTYSAPRPTAAGGRSGYDFTVPVATGTHVGCVWAVNVGLGNNAFLGCRAADTRGPASTATLSTPKLNTEVVAEAKKHIGQAYVWGAAGPKTFDCSGLVTYSYHKFGYTTPRVSEDQASKARLIPASRALPGDLVFTHDAEGDVYHVGIYVSPGRSVAAIDTQEGVNYQTVWDPADTTYGSFTHT